MLVLFWRVSSGRKSLTVARLLLVIVLSGGCLVAVQSGETPGGPIVLLYDTSFIRVLLYGRPAAILLLALAIGIPGRKSRIALGIALLMGVSALVLLHQGSVRLSGFRIESNDEALVLCLPPEEPREISWQDIVGMDLKGFKRQDGVAFAGFEHAEDWRTLKLKLKGGERIDLDLSRLAVGQRHVLQRAIRAHAKLQQMNAQPGRPFDDWRNALPAVAEGGR